LNSLPRPHNVDDGARLYHKSNAAELQPPQPWQQQCLSSLLTRLLLSLKSTYGHTISSGLIESTQTITVSSYMYSNEATSDVLTVLFVDVASGKRLTFNQLRTTGEEFGKGLQDQWQWRKGDVLATVSPNTVDLVPATFGALLAGGVICPLNPMYTVEELANQLGSSKARGVITNMACLQATREAASRVGLPLDRILLVGDEDPNRLVPHFSSLRSTSENLKRISINPKEDLAYLVYSSGTTGLPKGVMLTHENVVANSLQMTAAEGPDVTHWQRDRSLGFLPMYHIYGKTVTPLS
jgi:4-coumarate--CoA ligase